MVKWDFRDVSLGIKKIREFLLGRKYVYHHRFPPVIAPRTIPPPDVPRGPEYKYADQWYLARDALNSVKPPVVAPIAEGCKMGASPLSKRSAGQVKFPSDLPTPGCVWWWDAHCYYIEVPDAKPCGPLRQDAPVATIPKSPSQSPCKLDPCKRDPPSPPPGPCDPCDPPKC